MQEVLYIFLEQYHQQPTINFMKAIFSKKRSDNGGYIAFLNENGYTLTTRSQTKYVKGQKYMFILAQDVVLEEQASIPSIMLAGLMGTCKPLIVFALIRPSSTLCQYQNIFL